MKPLQVSYPLAVYYDKSCPLCAEEIHALKDYDANGRLSLIDCSQPGFSDSETRLAGLSSAMLMRRIHARDAAGKWLDGVAVFEAAYGAVGIDAVARLWGQPSLQPLLDRIYMWVAGHRMAISWLRLNKAYGVLVRVAARPAARKAEACAGAAACRLKTPEDHVSRPIA